MAVETTVDNEELSLLDDCCRLLRVHCSSDQSLTRGNSLVKYNIQVYIYGQLMWPSFLYSSTQYGRAASCVPRMHKSQFDREKGVWGEIHCSVNCVPIASALILYRGRSKGLKVSRHAFCDCGGFFYRCFLPTFLKFQHLKRRESLSSTYLGVLAARALIRWIHSIWQSHSKGLLDNEIRVYP